jgi:hypothetical protein
MKHPLTQPLEGSSVLAFVHAHPLSELPKLTVAAEDRLLLSVFDLHNNGQLYLDNSNGSTILLDSGVAKIAPYSSTSVFDLHSDGGLFVQNANTTRTSLTTGVQAMAQFGNDQVLYLTSNGKLFSQAAGANPAYQASTVEGLAQFGPNQVLYSVSNGTMNSWAYGASPVYQASTVEGLAQFGPNQVLYLTSSGTMNSWAYGSVAQKVGTSGIVAADGSIWYLGTTPVDNAGDQEIYQLISGGQLKSVCVTSAPIGSTWLGMGGPSSALGLPTGDVQTSTLSHHQAQTFQHGGLYWNGATVIQCQGQYSIPKLSSRTSATTTLYLDFAGHFEANWNDGTTNATNYNNVTTAVFDTGDGNPAMSPDEMDMIYEVYQRVAEAYSPFNINVTTVDPGQNVQGQDVLVAIGASTSKQGAPYGTTGPSLDNEPFCPVDPSKGYE